MKAAPARTQIQLKNIVFATDFSPAADIALPFATSLAQRFGAKLFVVHAKTPENYALPAMEIWPMANAQLEKEVGELRHILRERFLGLDSEVLIEEGGVLAVIEAIADQKNADLIVLGTNGRRGIGKFILGSVAEEILRRAKCAVLTVGPHSPADRPRETQFRKILFATDFGDASHSALAYAVALAQEHRAHLSLLHVIEHPKAGDLVRPHELEAAAQHRLRDFAREDTELWHEPKAIVAHGVPAEKILEAAQKEQADLIVLGVRNAKGAVRATHLPTAVVHQVISQATCPVLTVRA